MALTENEANKNLYDFYRATREAQYAFKTNIFIVNHLISEGKISSAIASFGDFSTYIDAAIFWPMFRTGRLSKTLLYIAEDVRTDPEYYKDGGEEMDPIQSLGLYKPVMEIPLYPTYKRDDERGSYQEAMKSILVNLSNWPRAKEPTELEAAEFLGNVDLNSLRPLEQI